MRRITFCVLAALLALSMTGVASADGILGITTRVSGAPDGAPANRDAEECAISADGRYVAFTSSASNLIPNDLNQVSDVFIRDTNTGITTLVSRASDGAQGNSWSMSPSVSADGRYVAFASFADNLVAGDTNGYKDVFVRDVLAGTTVLVSLSDAGVPANGECDLPSISADGQRVAFSTEADNLISGYTDRLIDVLVHDAISGVTTSTSEVHAEAQERIYVSDRSSISADGRYVAFEQWGVEGPTPGEDNAYLFDTVTRTKTCVNLSSEGVLGDGRSYSPHVSADGRFVAFNSHATNLVADDTNGFADVFLRDMITGAVTHVSVATDGTQRKYPSAASAISNDGRYVTFHSFAGFVAEDLNEKHDTYVRDTASEITTLESIASDGTLARTHSIPSGMSADGRFVVFSSTSSVLVPGGGSGHYQVYLRDREALHPAHTLPTLSFHAPATSDFRSARVYGYLKDAEGRILARRPVKIRYYDGVWKTAAVVYTDAQGRFFRTMAPKAKTSYQAEFAGNSMYLPEKSAVQKVLPRVKLRRSTSWTTLAANKTYNAKGYIYPKHAKSDSNKVKIRAYKKRADGSWRYVRSFTASYSYYSSTKTRYNAAVKLTSKGKWKLVAYHAADSRNAKTYGSPDYVTVK